MFWLGLVVGVVGTLAVAGAVEMYRVLTAPPEPPKPDDLF